MLDRSTRLNAVLLVGLQVCNYLLPFLLIPVLIRRLGWVAFGVWALAMAIVSALRTLVSYGFDMSGARDIAMRSDDRGFIGDLLSAVTAVRLVLLVVPGAILIVAAPYLNIELLTRSLMLLCVLTLLGDAIAPTWLYYGMGEIALANTLRIASRALLLVAVVFFVEGPDDILRVPLLEAVIGAIYGLVALVLAVRRYSPSLARPRLAIIRPELVNGFHIFLSNFAVHLYTTINGVVLGAILGPVMFAHYAVAEKIYSGVRGLIGAATQAVFPRLAKLSNDDDAAYCAMARRVVGVYFGVCCLAAVVLLSGSGLAIRIVSGHEHATAVACLNVFAVAMVFAMGTIFSMLLVVQKRTGTLSKVTALTCVVNLVVLVPLVSVAGAAGAVLAFLAAQVVQTVVYVWLNRSIMT